MLVWAMMDPQARRKRGMIDNNKQQSNKRKNGNCSGRDTKNEGIQKVMNNWGKTCG
jgi:hypothetical protein